MFGDFFPFLPIVCLFAVNDFNFLYLFIRLGSKLIYVRQSPVFLDKEVQMHNKKWYCMIVYFLCVDS